MSHWDFAGASHDDPYAADSQERPPREFPASSPPDADGGAGWDDGFAWGGDADGGEGLPYAVTYERAEESASAVSPSAAPVAEDERETDGAAGGHEAPAGPGGVAGDGQPGAAGEGGWQPPSRCYPESAWRGEAPPLFGSPGRSAAEPAPASPAPPEPPPAWLDWEPWPDRRRHLRVHRPALLAAGIAVLAAAGAGAAVLAAGHPGHPPTAPAAPRGTAATPATAGGTGAMTPLPGSAGATPATPASPAPAGASSAASSSASSSAGASSPAGAAAAGGAPGGAAPLTLARAQAVVAAYTTANNAANAARSDTALATIETGSSDAIDASLYQQGRASGAAPFPAFGPVRATYYLPRGEPASGPRWFAVRVANAFTAGRATVTSTEYLLFTQSSVGAPWLNALEPYLLSGAGAPPVATGPGGLATAVAPGAAGAVAPGRLPAVTAAALDTAGGTRPAVADPGNLADRADARLWRTQVPGGTVTDTHAPAKGAGGQEFALRTADGGALVFYTDAASVTVTPPAGTMLHVTVPGFFSPRQSLGRATVDYLEQFAAYDPPAGQGGPGVIADYSAITGTGTGSARGCYPTRTGVGQVSGASRSGRVNSPPR